MPRHVLILLLIETLRILHVPLQRRKKRHKNRGVPVPMVPRPHARHHPRNLDALVLALAHHHRAPLDGPRAEQPHRVHHGAEGRGGCCVPHGAHVRDHHMPEGIGFDTQRREREPEGSDCVCEDEREGLNDKAGDVIRERSIPVMPLVVPGFRQPDLLRDIARHLEDRHLMPVPNRDGHQILPPLFVDEDGHPEAAAGPEGAEREPADVAPHLVEAPGRAEGEDVGERDVDFFLLGVAGFDKGEGVVHSVVADEDRCGVRGLVPRGDEDGFALGVVFVVALDEDEGEVEGDDGAIDFPESSVDEGAVEQPGEDEEGDQRVHA
mmetsp:Transcript_25264/g.66308  ORF Transcript_25264/g.66308 Transcript_25264/m.66308 type:complete len:322 (+) Transcript_25264:1152-2117(+)